ncbi:MAG: hypothetical protein ACFFD7_06250 [Candidatus Thorarchaeota archaeon]
MLIVLYGYHTDDQVRAVNKILNEKFRTKGAPIYIENVRVISLEQYYELLGIDDKFIEIANKQLGYAALDIMDLGYKIIATKKASEREQLLDTLQEIYLKAREHIKDGTTTATTIDQFLGNK